MSKNILGMDMLEWKHLSGLADPYALALAEASVEAGVPSSVQLESKDPLSDLPDSPLDVHHGDDEPKVVATAGKNDRVAAIKRAARKLQAKTRGAAEKAATTPAADRHKVRIELSKHRKAFAAGGKNEGLDNVDPEILWCVYLEDCGTTAREFEGLLHLALESEDDELAVELLSVEDQLDELLGAVGGAMAKIGKGMGNVAGSAVKGFKAGMAGGGSPAGATPAAGAPAAAPAGTMAPASPAAPAVAATPAVAPVKTAAPAPAQASANAPAAAVQSGGAPPPRKQPGLLGTLGRGIGKVARGLGGVAAAPLKAGAAVAQGAAAGMRGESVDEWEAYLSEEFGLTAEQYVEMCDRAFDENDEDMIESIQQLDEIFGIWRKKKEAEEADKHKKTMASWKAAKDVVAKHGAAATKTASLHGKQVGTPKAAPKGSGTSVYAKKAESVEEIAHQIMESNGAFAPRERDTSLKALISSQLRFSGYSDEYIEGRSKDQQYAGQKAMAARSGKVPFRLPSKDGSIQNTRQTMKYGAKSLGADKLKAKETAKIVRGK